MNASQRKKKEMEGVDPDAVFTPVETQYIQEEYHVMLGVFYCNCDVFVVHAPKEHFRTQGSLATSLK